MLTYYLSKAFTMSFYHHSTSCTYEAFGITGTFCEQFLVRHCVLTFCSVNLRNWAWNFWALQMQRKLNLVMFWLFDVLSILSSYFSYRIQLNLKLLKLQVRRTVLHSENVVRLCPCLYLCFLRKQMFNKNVPLRQDSSNSFLSLLSRGRSQDGASFLILCPIIFCWIFDYRCTLRWWCNGIYSIALRQNKVCIGRAAQIESRSNCRWFSPSTSRAGIQPTSLRPFPQVRDVPLYQFCSF